GVESLVSKSLLQQREGRNGEPRFWMLETIQEFASEKMEESGEAEQLRQAHAAYFVSLAEEAEGHFRGSEQIEWLARLEDEHDNMRAALTWSLGAHDDTQAALRIAGALMRFWEMRGYMEEGSKWLDVALKQSDDADKSRRAKAFLSSGTM